MTVKQRVSAPRSMTAWPPTSKGSISRTTTRTTSRRCARSGWNIGVIRFKADAHHRSGAGEVLASFRRVRHSSQSSIRKAAIRPFPEILVISNAMKDGKPTGAIGNSEATWHTDTWFYERPPAGAILRAIELPPSGGDTYFLSTYQRLRDAARGAARSCGRAADLLPERLRQDRQTASRQGGAEEPGFSRMERRRSSAGADARGVRPQGALSRRHVGQGVDRRPAARREQRPACGALAAHDVDATAFSFRSGARATS